ncbi:sulfite exporter TauE/SafE family protein [Methanoplanus sp. FWC-SCC4]|uniref:Probable membrane transporter protein n=1 Tax=Methanochimaera problematica TaxID=2609417 RepID=A0AA97FDD8_9EURY|nr:sulfite exporter TauE/SafE family protein [Methanoplanus sp. FWC-SCC4]WOF16174.1 sulfite exporter TauE/SafE family protein [Methanoplanus sp. FWC-SCC4]
MEPFFLSIVILLLTGIVAGLASGMLGFGGAFILVPAQYWVLSNIYGIDDTISIRIAFATSLAVVFPTSVASAIGHSGQKSVLWKAAFFLGVTGFFGGIFGGVIATSVDGAVLKLIFSVLLFSTAGRMVYKSKKPVEREMMKNPFIFMGIGFFIGVLCGLLGLGGGLVMVPVLILFCNFPPKKAVGTSSGFILFSSAGALIPYILFGSKVSFDLPFISIGYISLFLFLILVAVSVPMAHAGTEISKRTDESYVRIIFAALLIITGLQMLIT